MYEDARAFFDLSSIWVYMKRFPLNMGPLWVHLQDQIGEVDRLKRKWWHPRDRARVANPERLAVHV